VSHYDRLAHMFPDLPPAVLLKADLLRHGVRLDTTAAGSRHYHHHDARGQKTGLDPRAHVQGSVELPGGVHAFITHNEKSPYVLRPADQGFELSIDARGDGHEEVVIGVGAGPRFAWTSARTSRGTPLATLFTPSLGGACGPVAVFLLRHCEFAVAGEECRFCSWVRMGKSVEMRPDVDEMREAFSAITAEQRSVGYLAFSGGSLFNRAKEADAFLDYMRAARETGARLPATVAAIQALDRDDSIRLRDAGFDYVCYSMEVWHERAWPEVLPGKSRSLGRARWMECLLEAVEVFGRGRVLCNFVAGVEAAVPGLFRSEAEAAESTLDGMRWCDEHGIYPKYAAWIVSGGARYGDRTPPSLDYLARVMAGRQALYAESSVPVPATDCQRCLTQSFEADLAVLDPARYGRGQAAVRTWRTCHPRAHANLEP
jgi:hypothetical protein